MKGLTDSRDASNKAARIFATRSRIALFDIDYTRVLGEVDFIASFEAYSSQIVTDYCRSRFKDDHERRDWLRDHLPQ